jgi:hypothetical protein
MFCTTRLTLGGTKSAESQFHVLRPQTCFRRFRGHHVPFLCFATLDIFSTLPRKLGPIFLTFVPRLIFAGTKGTTSSFHVLRSRLIFDGTVGVGYRFHILRSRTRFQRSRGRQVPFSCFMLPDSFGAVPKARPFFIFCAPRLVFDCTECIESRFHVLRYRTPLVRYRGFKVPF